MQESCRRTRLTLVKVLLPSGFPATAYVHVLD